jgi:hypothetical protein
MSRVTHRLAETRSLALHTEVARQLKLRPEALETARRRVRDWLEKGGVSDYWARKWFDVLAGSIDEVIAVITDTGEEARDLRQTSPFAGVIDPRKRWSILREIRKDAVSS